jgi:NDP-sugar pyrophosphorylase family protein
MRGMLVAAGFGTRLSPLTDELPKPAVPVGNRPVAAYALEALARAGIRDVVVNTHHLAAELERELSPWCPSGVDLRYVHEPVILGTGGGVRNAWAARGGPIDGEDFVVMNAKLVFTPDLARALEQHRRSGAIATMVLRALPTGTTFAPVEHDASGRIHAMRGLPRGHRARDLQRAMFTGVQILSARAFADLPLDGDMIEGAYKRWLECGEHVQGVIDDGAWLDVGVTVEHYVRANLALARREIAWPDIEPDAAGNIIDGSVRVPHGAQLREVVLGRGAVVPEGAELARVVAWPGAKLPSQLSDATVTSRGVIAR